MAHKYAEIGSRLRKFGKERFGSMASFARALGLIPSNLTAYLSGRVRPGNALQLRLRELGCNIEWLMTGRARYGVESDLRPVHAAVPAGRGGIAVEPPTSFEYAPPDSDDRGRGYWLRVKGDSMFPAIKDSQLVFVNPEREVRENDFCVAVWNEHQDGAIKQVNFEGSDVILSSVNQAYKPIVLHRKKISMIARICYIKL